MENNNNFENSEWDFFSEDESQRTKMIGKIKKIGMMALEQKDWLDVVRQNHDSLSAFSKYLNTTEFQTAIFIAVFYYIYFMGEYEVTVKELVDFFSTKQIMIMQHKQEITKMRSMGILKIKTKPSTRNRILDYDDDSGITLFNDWRFMIPESVVLSIINEKELKREDVVETPKDFLIKINKMLSYAETDEFYDFYEEFQCFEADCVNVIKEIGKIKDKISSTQSRVLFYVICLDTVFARQAECCLSERITQIVDNSSEQMKLLKNLISEDDNNPHILVKEKLIEINEARMAEDATANVTNEGLDLMFGENAVLYKGKNVVRDIIEAGKITKKNLFFSGSTKEQLDRIYATIEEKKFKEIQKRLSKKGMCQGIAALLYGAPGTGKTESVYQMAKETNRDIYHVDISQTKTAWYGESPKRVKKIFKRYKEICKEARNKGKNIPILLLNEADALITTRKNVSDNSSSCDKEDNTIQNVVLEELETFEGIMIATTNLAKNMDAAFERRFLFKVEFKKPDVNGRAKIWKSKIKSLSENDAKEIASDYDFSGGEIDNITRKMELEEVISGRKPSMKKIRELCRTEKIATESSGRAIGFGVTE